MATTRKPTRKLKVVKTTPKVNKYARAFDATKFAGILPELDNRDFAAMRREMWGGSDDVNEPAVTYGRTAPRTRTKKVLKRKGYDAKKYTGMIPGIAERMKEYLRTVRDDR